MSYSITTGIAGGGLLTTVLGFLGKLAWGSIQHDRKMLADIHNELTLQRTNCLNTLQSQGERQIEVLEKIDDRIAEQIGYLKGVVDGRH